MEEVEKAIEKYPYACIINDTNIPYAVMQPAIKIQLYFA